MAETTQNVTRAEFTQFQQHIVDELKALHRNDAKIYEALDAIKNSVHQSARPNLQLTIMILSLGLGVVIAVGGLVAYGFKSEITHTQSRIELLSASNQDNTRKLQETVGQMLNRELDELEARRAEERKVTAHILDLLAARGDLDKTE